MQHFFLEVLNLFGPRQANLVLIAYASSKGSGEPAHPRSLARTSALAHTSSESRGTFRQKARSLAPLNGWACAVKICHDGMLEDTNSLDGAHFISLCLLTMEQFSLPIYFIHPLTFTVSLVYLTNISLASHFGDIGKQCRLRSDATERGA